jgi:glucose/arabinose dehydrogenase
VWRKADNFTAFTDGVRSWINGPFGIFFTERPGRIRVIQNGAVVPQPWATLPVTEQPGSEWGLLGLALDSDFAANHFVYVYCTAAGGGRNRIVRLRDEGRAGVPNKVLLDGIPAASNHSGGRLKFGPDGGLDAVHGAPVARAAPGGLRRRRPDGG